MQNKGSGKIEVTVLALALAALLSLEARGQHAPPPVITPVVTDALLDQATVNGNLLLSKAKWKVSINNPAQIRLVGNELYGEWTGLVNPQNGQTRKTFSLDAQTGHMRWSVTEPDVGVPVGGPIVEVTDAGIEVLRGDIGKLTLRRLAKDSGNPTVVWEATFGGQTSIGAAPNPTFAGQQVIAGGTFLSRVRPGVAPRPTPMAVRSFDRPTGKEQWATPLEGGAAYTSKPLVVNGTVYLAVDQSIYPAPLSAMQLEPKSFLVALNAADGKVLWKTQAIPARQLAPVVKGPLLVTGTEDGEIIAYDAKSGKEKWRRMISPDCDSTKSKVGSIDAQSTNLFLDGDRVLVPVIPAQESKGPGAQAGSGPAVVRALGTLAVFDLRNGQQVGYFCGINRRLRQFGPRPPVTTVLQVYKNTIISAVFSESSPPNSSTTLSDSSVWCMGINRKTLELEFFIPYVLGEAAVSEDTLYLGTANRRNSEITISALPLAAWDEIKTQK